MNYNVTGWENVSGFESLIAINQTAHFWPMTLFVLLVTFTIYTIAKQAADTPMAAFLACLVMALSSGGLYITGLGSASFFGLASILTVFTGLMMIYKQHPDTT